MLKNHTPRWLVAFALMALSLVMPGSARAHSPIFNDLGSPSLSEAFRVEDIEVSKAILGAIRQPGAIDYYRFDLPEGELLEVSVFVPVACEAFFPQVALIGTFDNSTSTALSLEIPTGYQVKEFNSPASEWGTYFEPFDPAFYHEGPKVTVRGDERPLYLAIYNSENTRGAYMLGTSGAERWQPAENWRDRKASYDQCEIGQSNLLLSRWRDLVIGAGIVGMVTVAAGLYLKRTRFSRNL